MWDCNHHRHGLKCGTLLALRRHMQSHARLEQTLQVTSWFDGRATPVREGPYQRREPAGPYSCWAQGRWYGDAATPEAAARARRPSRRQHAPWRGLAADAGLPCATCRGNRLVDQGIDPESGEDLIDDCLDCEPA